MRLFISGPDLLFDPVSEEFAGRSALKAIIDEIPSIRIVLTDTSRSSMTVNEVRALFPESFRPNVEGVVEVVGSGKQDYARQQEVEHYQMQKGSCPYVVVDNMPELFESLYPFLMTIERGVPLSVSHVPEIIKMITGEDAKSESSSVRKSMPSGPLIDYNTHVFN